MEVSQASPHSLSFPYKANTICISKLTPMCERNRISALRIGGRLIGAPPPIRDHIAEHVLWGHFGTTKHMCEWALSSSLLHYRTCERVPVDTVFQLSQAGFMQRWQGISLISVAIKRK